MQSQMTNKDIDVTTESYVPIYLDSFSRSLVDQLIVLIMNDSLNDIIQIFERLHPDISLNILDFSSDGYTLLFLAILTDRFEISKYLIKVSRRRGTRKMCDQWKLARHPLGAALNVKNKSFVEYIAPIMCDMNESIYGTMTPLIIAIFSANEYYVEAIVREGADVNICTSSGLVPLMLSTLHPKICRYLLTTNVDLDYQDIEGNTALHQAVSDKKWQSLIRLVDAGADIQIRNQEDMSPLMVASVNMNLAAVRFLSRRGFTYTELEKIEALEVLGACNIFASKPIFIYWSESLDLRGNTYVKTSPFPPQEILDFSKEFTKREDLEGLQNKNLKLAFQGVLIIERVLGRKNSYYLYVLLKTVMVARCMNNLAKVRQLMNYIFTYFKTVRFTLVSNCYQTIKILFNMLTEDLDPENLFLNGGFILFKMISQVTKVMCLLDDDRVIQNSNTRDTNCLNTVDLFLYMTSVITCINLSKQKRAEFFDVVSKVVKLNPRVINEQSLLHRTITYMDSKPWATVKLIRVLLETGIDVNTKDHLHQTPLMFAFRYTPITILQDVVNLLEKYGAETDCVDENFVFSLKFSYKMRELVTNCDSLTNENSIVNYREPYADILDDFMKLHF